MKKTMISLTILVIGCLLVVEPATAQEKRGRNTTISTDGEKRITDCEQLRMRIDDVDAIRSQLTQTVPQSAFSTLQVRAPRNGGIHVQGWNRSEYSVTGCFGVSADKSDARAILDQLRVSIADGQVTIEGPNPQDWLAYVLIQAPVGAALDLTAVNGPIGVTDFAGTVKARNQNGPVTFYEVNGQVRADVQNGPITVSGSGGDFRLTAQNGPLTIKLDGSQWSGGELEGSTQNGPLTLNIPDNYMSTVRVDASKHSPVQCKAIQCKQAVRTWDQPSQIQFGESTPVIRLSTINGPVTIVSPGSTR